MSERPNQWHSRRKVLQASVAGAALPFSVNTVAGRADEDPVVIRRQGTYSDPLDVAEMMDLKRKAIRLHEQRGGDVEFEQFVNGVPRFEDDAELVDYVVGVQPDGSPVQHAGIAGNAQSVPGVRSDADEKAERIHRKASGEGAGE